MQDEFWTVTVTIVVIGAVLAAVQVLMFAKIYRKTKPGCVLIVKTMRQEPIVSRNGRTVIPIFHQAYDLDIRPFNFDDRFVIEVMDDDKQVLKFAEAFCEKSQTEILEIIRLALRDVDDENIDDLLEHWGLKRVG